VWAQLVAFAAGVWLTAAPGVVGYGPPARPNDHIFGPLAATAGLIAAFEVTRAVRWVNLPVGAWLVLAPWVLGYGTGEAANSTATGLLLAATACLRGRAEESFGGGWRVLWDPAADPARSGVRS
jgi:hypothetical protein